MTTFTRIAIKHINSWFSFGSEIDIDPKINTTTTFLTSLNDTLKVAKWGTRHK